MSEQMKGKCNFLLAAAASLSSLNNDQQYNVKVRVTLLPQSMLSVWQLKVDLFVMRCYLEAMSHRLCRRVSQHIRSSEQGALHLP